MLRGGLGLCEDVVVSCCLGCVCGLAWAHEWTAGGGTGTDVDVLQRIDELDRCVGASVPAPVLGTPVGGPEGAVEEGGGGGLVAGVVAVGDGRGVGDLRGGEGAEVVEAVVGEGGGCGA